MKMIEYFLTGFLAVLLVILPGCGNKNVFETSLSDKQLEVNTFNGEKETVFFLRSKNYEFTSFIEESPGKNFDTQTMYAVDYSTSKINTALSLYKRDNPENPNSLNSEANVLYQNTHKEIFYIYPENNYYVFCKNEETQIIGKIRVSSSKKPLMWNPLNLFSWKIYINSETGLVDYYDMETNSLLSLSMNTLPKQIFETNNYLLMTSETQKSALLCNRNTGEIQTIKNLVSYLGSSMENDVFVFSNTDNEVVFFNGNSPNDQFSINLKGYNAEEVTVKKNKTRLLFYVMSKEFLSGSVNDIYFVNWDTDSKKYTGNIFTLLLPNPEAKKITYSSVDLVDLSFFVISENGCPYSVISFNPIEEYLIENIFKYSTDFSESRFNVNQVQKNCNDTICWSMMLNEQKEVGNDGKRWIPIFCFSRLPK